MESNKISGITLIALVVTIIVLIILATISINAVFGENGLIKKAEQSKEKQALAEELERLELIKGEVLADGKNKGKISVDIYVNELISKGIVDSADVIVESDVSKTVITDAGYEVNIAPDGAHNVIITINGKAADAALKPKINNVTTSLEAVSEIGITIDATNADSYEIQYKKTTETSYKSAYSGKNNSYTIKGLDADAIYNIRIIVTNSYGSRIRDINARAGLPSGVGAIEFTDFKWNGGKAEVKINKVTEENYEMQYRVLNSTGDEKVTYTLVTSGTIVGNLDYEDVVEARLWNGKVGGNVATLNVEDGINPNTATLTYYDETDTEITGDIEIENGSTIKIKVEQSDNESGVEIANCKWVINTNSGSIGTEETNYTETFTATPENITFTQTTADEYYLHILTVDKAGKPKETISKMIKVKPVGPVTVTGDELKGAFIKYDVEYTDTSYFKYQYTSTNGWRLMNYDLDADGKTLRNVKLISTGLPAMMYYKYDDTTNNYLQWVTKIEKDNDEDITPNLTTFENNVLGSDYTTYTGSLTDYKALQASAGFYYNLGNMTFTQGTNYKTNNMGYYTKVKNGSTEYTTGSTTGNNLFKARSDASIRMLTLPELNTALGRKDIDSTDTFTDTTGLYDLNNISKGTALTSNKYISEYYWLASPYPKGDDYFTLLSVGSDGYFWNYWKTYCSVRLVVELSSNIQLLRKKATTTDGIEYEYYEIVDIQQ